MIRSKRLVLFCILLFSLSLTLTAYQPSLAATDCQGSVIVRFIGFEPFGTVHLEIQNSYPTIVTLSDFQINWIQRLPGVLTLHQITTVAPFGQPNSYLIWKSSGITEDATPPTSAHTEGQWISAYNFPAANSAGPSITALYLDFDGVTGLLSDIGVTPSDFNGSQFTFIPFCNRSAPQPLSIPSDGHFHTVIGDIQGVIGSTSLQIYVINGSNVPTLALTISSNDFAAAPAHPTGNYAIAVSDNYPLIFYKLTTGEYQFQIGPDRNTGKTQFITFTGYPPTNIYMQETLPVDVGT